MWRTISPLWSAPRGVRHPHLGGDHFAAPETGGGGHLYTYLHVTENMLDLFGFCDQSELNCFRMLITVTRVGPEALSVLSTVTPERFALCVASGDAKTLAEAPGLAQDRPADYFGTERQNHQGAGGGRHRRRPQLRPSHRLHRVGGHLCFGGAGLRAGGRPPRRSRGSTRTCRWRN